MSNTLNELIKPVMLMVTVQSALAAVNIFYKLAAADGMNLRVLVAYRFLFAAAFITPIAFIIERNKRPKLTWMGLIQAFSCGLFGGALAQNLFAAALKMTSATFVSALSNLTPVITYVLTICLRIEKLGWRTTSGMAKLVGTLVGLCGAMLLTFYKGIELHVWTCHIDLLPKGQGHVAGSRAHQESGKMVLGSLLGIISCFSFALWIIIQSKLMKNYPCPYSITALTTLMGSVQGVVFAVTTQEGWSDWKLGLNIRLLSVVFMGLIGSVLVFMLMAWCIRMRGPLFVSAFNPLLLVLVAIVGSLFLNEILHLGSVIGAVLIICGLYAVLWGTSREVKKASQLMLSKDSGEVKNVEDKAVEITVSSTT